MLSTCSEYFEDIFGRIECKHPFIIMKDVEPHHLEALLNYMYKGEVNVLQESLPGLIKAAEALKIKGLAVPDEPVSKEKFLTNREKRRSTASNSPSDSQPNKLCKVESPSQQKQNRLPEDDINSESSRLHEDNSSSDHAAESDFELINKKEFEVII